MTLSRQEILVKMKSAKKSVYIKTWDSDILLKELSAGVILNLSQELKDKAITDEEFTFNLIVESVIDEDGNSIFTMDEARELSVSALSEIATAIGEYNGLNVIATEKANQELKKSDVRFYFKLALALGWPSVELMLDTLSYKELQFWIAYFSIEPFPEDRQDLRTALLATTLANIWKSKDTKAFELTDFIFDFWKEDKPSAVEPVEVLANKVLALKAIYGG